MIKNKYDVVVIGSALGGLISGALLAKRGFDVLVANQEKIPWSFPFEHFALQRESLPGQGFKRYIFETVFEELNIDAKERLLFERAQPLFQVVLKDHRLDISSNHDVLLQEYRREFPKSIDSITRFYKTIDEVWQNIRKNYSKQTLQSPLSNPFLLGLSRRKRGKSTLNHLFEALRLPIGFRQTVKAQLGFLSHIHTENPTLMQAAQVLSATHRKDYYFLGQSHELAKIFCDRIRYFGGSIRDDAFVEKLHGSPKGVTGARLNTYEGVVQGRSYIGNIELHRLFDLFEDPRKPRAWQKRLDQFQPSFARCMMFLGVREKVLPVGMKSQLIFIADPARPLVEDNMVFLQVIPQEKGAKEENPIHLLQISFLLPYPKQMEGDFSDFNRNFFRVSEKVYEHIKWLIPYLEQHLVFRLPAPTALRDYDGVLQKQLIQSFLHLPLLRGLYELPEGVKFFGFRNQTHIPNLFFTGPEVFPSLGFEGETISCLNAANLAHRAMNATLSG